MIQQTVTRVLWGLAATGVAMFASSCASPPGQEDGLIGLVYHAVDRDHHKAKPTVVYSQPKAVEPIPQPAAMEPAPAHREPVPYRTSPGDVLQVSYFRRPPGNDARMYHVESLDVLTIHVAGDQHYSTDVTVRPDGRITFFEIGDVDVRGMTIQDVRGALLDRFHEVVPSAEISVFLKKGNGLVDDFLQTLMSDREGTMRTLKVRHDGRVGLPLVGEIEVVGRTLPELSEELEKRYDE
ncbi:MAG TPA: polysaccharide biosynthesis/export family protein, partial [Kiritimatiellia bacterium]